MSETAWNKAFTHGSRALQDRLKKVHAKNPKFQAWMKSSGHGSGESVKQASKEVKPTARVKTLQTKSLQAYGATKGVKVGGEHGSEDMKDTIKPLTRDQHSKIQAAERAAKATAKTAAPKTPKVKKPLTQDERMAAIRRAFTKAKAKDRFDVPTVNPDDADHDDLMDVHQSLHVRRGYNEEVEQIDELKLSDVLKATHGKSPEEKQKIIKAMREKERASKPAPTPRKPEPAKDIPMHQRVYPDSMKYHGDSVELEGPVMNEGAKEDAEKMLGGPVKTKPKNAPAGKLPYGFRRARNLARQAMRGGVSAIHRSMEKTMQKENVTESTTEVSEVNEMNHGKKLAKMIMAKQSKHPIAQHMGEEIEQVTEQDDTMEKKEMAQTQLHFMAYAAKEILEFIDMGGEIEEWYQNKLSKVQSEVESLHSYIEGEKRRTGMVKEEEQIDEKAPPGAKYERMVKHIKKGYAKGGLTPKEKSIAYATAWKAYGKKEEVEQTDEAVRIVDVERKGLPKKPDVRNRLAQAAKERRKITGEPGVKGFNKPIGFSPTKYMDTSYVRAIKKEEVVTEAEGTVAVTPKEKALAAHHGDKSKITYGDVIKARLKSVAAKKMGK